jgi:ABC-type polysaccharide/polyol phosphate transport system ATPase subunit
MVARLGFSIATDIQPDILILDEVLSVGDESFKRKCQKRMERFWDANATILVVSHSMDFIKQSCNKAIWLDKGNLKIVGESKEVIQCYIDSVN